MSGFSSPSPVVADLYLWQEGWRITCPSPSSRRFLPQVKEESRGCAGRSLTSSLQQTCVSESGPAHVHVFRWQLITTFFLMEGPECAWASPVLLFPPQTLTALHICAIQGGSQISFSVLSLSLNDQSWRVGVDRPCVEAPRDSPLLVHAWLLMIDDNFCCFLTSFCGCHHQRRNSSCVFSFLRGACHSLEFVSPVWTLQM